jgi:hypothetical protein
MTDRLPLGPYRTIPVPGGVDAPWYVIPFDKDGRCTGPRTRDHLVTALENGDYSDVYVFSHGWNNAWAEASSRYEHFITGYGELRRNRGLGRDYRPLLIGVFWPSAVLVLPWERGPQFAAMANGAARDDMLVAQERREVEELAGSISSPLVERFYEFAQLERDLTEPEAKELAEMLAPLYSTDNEELLEGADPPDGAELLEVWSRLPAAEPRTPSVGDVEEDFGTVTLANEELRSAGILGWKARDAIRATTVWMMKDRAGVVGAKGVGPLLVDALGAATDAAVHMVGHSYGCKVCLSAISVGPLPRAVASLLLLQPAVNHLCFAEDATGDGRPGGYRVVMDRVVSPILSTFSAHDQALTRFFHLAVRRGSDLGEMRIAGAPPSRYAALGGFGPRGCGDDCREIMMPAPGEPYPLSEGPRIFALNATAAISSHGDVSNDATWWALYSQVAAGA